MAAKGKLLNFLEPGFSSGEAGAVSRLRMKQPFWLSRLAAGYCAQTAWKGRIEGARLRERCYTTIFRAWKE
jgi:hypothetical protein